MLEVGGGNTKKAHYYDWELGSSLLELTIFAFKFLGFFRVNTQVFVICLEK